MLWLLRWVWYRVSYYYNSEWTRQGTIRWVFDWHRWGNPYLYGVLITLVKDLLADVIVKKGNCIGWDDADYAYEVDIFFH